MAQRTVALCDGKIIGIELIYTVINGQQINIPEKLKELRAKSHNNELFCPCGCGSKLILVAGDKNLREQHFRLKGGAFNQECKVITEGKISVDSKIVLKCWLDDKLKAMDIESRVPLHVVDDINKKYEFSFLTREKKIALSYCHERVNLSDEKLELLENNSKGIQVIYVLDFINGGSDGQYPEGLMKIQNKQGYCLLLTVEDADYCAATMKAVFYATDIDGFWQEVSFADGQLSEFSINASGKVIFLNCTLDAMKVEAETKLNQNIEAERFRRVEEEKSRAENLKRLLEEEEIKREEIRKREEDFKHNMESNFLQQETQVRDAEGNRWIKCEFCGKIAKEKEFGSYGGIGHINLGKCKECSDNNLTVRQQIPEMKIASERSKYNPNICPECGGRLRERSGPYGRFMGCSNYPTCRFNKKISN